MHSMHLDLKEKSYDFAAATDVLCPILPRSIDYLAHVSF